MLADVDMSGCYLAIAGRLDVYWGRPVVLEPGASAAGRREPMTLKEAVGLVRPLAPDDGWLVYVTGPICGYLNAMIPSLEGAVTWQNYTARRKNARRRAAWGPDPAEQRGRAAAEDGGRTHLYTDQVDFGVVAWPTWLMIQVLPPAARAEYERLRVESVVFYPRHLIANSGQE
jgi:hypothetical protein